MATVGTILGLVPVSGANQMKHEKQHRRGTNLLLLCLAVLILALILVFVTDARYWYLFGRNPN
jgi:hypothetical protein